MAQNADAANAVTTSLVSRYDRSGAVAEQGAFSPSLSGDGRFVAFESRSLLAGSPTGGVLQVFVRDRVTGKTVQVSRANGAAGAPANDQSDAPSISADGRYVAFESSATNLVPNFVPGDRSACDSGNREFLGDVFVRDLVLNTTTLVSHAFGSPNTAANAYSEDPQISRDGSTVVFDSAATNLNTDAEPDRGCDQQLFVADRAAPVAKLVRTSDNNIPNGVVDAFAISGDGKVVALTTFATNMLGASAQPASESYTQVLATGATEIVSRASGDSGAIADQPSGSVSLNQDGSLVLFASEATNLGTANASNQQVYLRNRTSPATTVLVSQTTGGVVGDGDSGPAVLSADGQMASFETAAPNLGGSTTPNNVEITQVATRNLTLGTTALASRSAGGATGDSGSSDPAISGNGQSVAFESGAKNLTADNTQLATQLFVRGPGVAPLVTKNAKTAGVVRVGSRVTCSATFAGNPPVSYSWTRNGVTVAVGAAYTIPETAYNTFLACRASASNGEAVTTSTSVAAKVAAGPALRATTRPVATGTAHTGSRLTASPGRWTPAATSYTYQWVRDGHAISRARSSTYLVTTSDKGHTLACTVTARRTGWLSGVATTGGRRITG